MSKPLGLAAGLLLFFQPLMAQINPENVTIVRDKWGVPHVYGKTDEDAAYGFAWATCEDDFKTMQEHLLAVRSRLAEVKGKDGAVLDVLGHMIKARELVDSLYETDLSPKFRAVVEAYAEGANAYAMHFPKELLAKNLFPVTGKDIVAGHVISLSLMTNVHYDIIRIFEGTIKKFEVPQSLGSNSFAIRNTKTTDDKTYLAVNSHQPIEGMFSWYEAHVNSEEGWNMLGGTFPGGPVLYVGTNENLGWAHTLNYPDHDDVYKLTMHPKEKLTYRFDGKWVKLEERPLKLKVKLGFLKIGIKQKLYWSKYGPTLKNKEGFYAIRFGGFMDIRSAEQWYWMNKAKNWDEFMQAMKMEALPGTNIVYADRKHNIYFASLGKFGKRNPKYNWKKVLPGDTSATLWEWGDFYPLDSLPQKLNPKCGYLLNTNNSPFNCTCYEENPDSMKINPTMGFLRKDNNRAIRFQNLIAKYDKLNYEDFKKIKYDRNFENPLYSYSIENIERIFQLDSNKYPDIADMIKLMKNWNRSTEIQYAGGSAALLILRYVTVEMFKLGLFPGINSMPDDFFAEALRYAKKHLKKHFKTIHVPLGEMQRHIRGDVNLPVGGTDEVIAAMRSEPWKKGKFKASSGESYIELVRYSEEGVEIESINAYGASAKPDSPHYIDQMEMYVQQKLKKMTLNKKQIFKEAEKVYHPN